MEHHTYTNPWIPKDAIEILEGQQGTILDVGGGAAPYFRATHVLDIIPYEGERLMRNAWGGEPHKPFQATQYTVQDICTDHRWPFDDDQFDLGLSSHTLEDLRDPLPALAELGRVCKKLLIITPSRLLEQTRGIAHPLYCGFCHHPWAVFQDEQGIVFRRKTALMDLPGCHLKCPLGKTLPVDLGAFMYYGPAIRGREMVFWSGEGDVQDYRQYLEPYRAKSPFVADTRPVTIKRRIYRMRQRFLGIP